MSDRMQQRQQSPALEHVLSPHLIGWGDPAWAFWRDAGLRGAGFPVAHVLKLASPASAARADQVLQAETRLEHLRQGIISMLRQALDQASDQARPHYLDVLRTVRRAPADQIPVSKFPPELDIAPLQAASEDLRLARHAFQVAYAESTAGISREIRNMIRDPRFLEALTWQNRRAVHRGIDSLLRHQAGANSKQRRNEALVANYLQRYCTKNDTIGFFGPVGWANLTDEHTGIQVAPGADLLATRTVYFEWWPLDALARKLAANPTLRPWLKPRRVPYIHLDQTTLSLPFSQPLALPRKTALVLQACDGTRTAREIAALLLSDPACALADSEEVYAILDSLQAANRITWTLFVPPEGSHPEQELRQSLEEIADATLRQAGLESLDELIGAREQVTKAAGSAEALDEAMERLEHTFTCLTGTSPTRLAGQTYAARTLVYEDCRRDLSLRLGSESINELGRPLSLLLTSARWFTYSVARLYQKAFLEAHMKLSQKKGTSTVDFADFWSWTQPRFFNDDSSLASALIPLFQNRWAQILALPGGLRRVDYTSQQLRPRVQELFKAPAPGWQAARYHTPDILIQAAGPQALHTGDYIFVLGEMHIALNTLRALSFYAQHPAPERMMQAVVADLPDPLVQPVISPSTLPVSRTRPAPIAPKDFRLVFAADACPPEHAQVLTTGDLVVERVADELFVLTRDRRLRFPVLEVFAESLSAATCDCFQLLPARPHRPRVTIDRLVVVRESWRFAPTDLSFVQEKDGPDRFLAVRRWMQMHELPRFAFVRAPVEQKPCFVDFESPIYIDAFARLIRRTLQEKGPAAFTEISEMLPTPHECWLPDAQGNRYTGELRLVVVDQY